MKKRGRKWTRKRRGRGVGEERNEEGEDKGKEGE